MTDIRWNGQHCTHPWLWSWSHSWNPLPAVRFECDSVAFLPLSHPDAVGYSIFNWKHFPASTFYFGGRVPALLFYEISKCIRAAGARGHIAAFHNKLWYLHSFQPQFVPDFIGYKTVSKYKVCTHFSFLPSVHMQSFINISRLALNGIICKIFPSPLPR